MKTRRLASLALIAAAGMALTGCNMISTQATLIEYNAADGVLVDTGSLEIRDAVIISEDGTDGNLIGAVVNTSDEAQTLRLEFSGADGATTETVRVPAGEVRTLGHNDGEPVLLSGIDTIPGASVLIHFSSGDDAGTELHVPVLDGSLPQYEDFVPKG